MSEQREPDFIEELAGLPKMAHPAISPDRDRIALYYDVTGRNELHVFDTNDGTLEQWSEGDVPRDAKWPIKWDADGEGVLFHRDEGGNEQHDIYRLESDGGVEPIVEMEGQIMLFDVGGDTILFGSNRDGQMNLFRQDRDAGETTKLTEYDRAVRIARLSPDGARIAYATNESDDFDNRDVYIANADGTGPRNLEIGEIGAEAAPVDWTPGGSGLLVADNSTDLGRTGLYDLDADETTWYGDERYDESPVGVLPDGDRIVVKRDRKAASVPVVYDLETGEGRELDVPEGVAFGRFNMNPSRLSIADGRLVFLHSTPTRRPELLAYDLGAGQFEVLIEAEYGPFEPGDFVGAEYFTVDSDGVPETPAHAVDHEPYRELEIGALLFDSGERPSPLVVHPHGGPRWRDQKSFDINTQVLTMQGYSVLQVNYRGSTGRGREFAEELIGDWGGAEQGDVATAVEHVLDTRDWIDEDRVAVFGGSYGGYSAYWQLVQYPDLYDAGIAWIGVTDLEDMYENTLPHFKTELMEKYLGTPAENPELYEERSPIAYVENIDAPLLIAHGVNDRRVPVSQARLFKGALESDGLEAGDDADFEYHELGEEGHGSTDQDQKLRTFRLLDDFLARRIG